MNWTHIFRIFESTRGDRSSASSGFLHALKSLFPAQSGSRRPKAEACGQAERLEIRQVLSVANVVVVMNAAAVSELEPQASGCDGPTAEKSLVEEAVGEADPGVVKLDSSQSPRNDWQASDSILKQTGLSTLDGGLFLTVNRSENFLNSSNAVPTTPSTVAGITSALDDSLTSVIDEVFHDSGKILDSSSPSSAIVESDSSAVLLVPERLTPSSNNPNPVIAVPVSQNAAGNLPETASGFVIAVAENSAPVSISSTSSQSSGWNWWIWLPSVFADRTLRTATVASRQSLTVPVAVGRSVDRPSSVSVGGDADHGWLAEISWFSTAYNSSTSWIASSPVAAETLPVAVPLVNDGVNLQRSLQNLTITAQTKARSFHEGQRQNSTSTKLIEVSHQHDSLPDLIDSEDVPRALKYVILPRGPPRKQPDTVLRIMDSDAEAHVLQRLRYSIAPRGPSTVTVKMQSPEKRSFSGPRVSPEESLSVRLGC